MYKIKVGETFSSAHMLRGYKGDCERLHGHNYRVEVTLGSTGLNDIGILADFREARQAVKDILRHFDHQFLNDLPEFASLNPSAENIAKLIFDKLSPKIAKPASLLEVEVWENDGCSAIYCE